MKKGIYAVFGIVFLLSLALVSATSLETNKNEQLIIRSSCSGVDAISEITIYSGTEIVPDNLVVLRTLMTAISPTDFVYTTSFPSEGMYRAQIECTFNGGMVSSEAVMINVTPKMNMIVDSTKTGYDYEALLGYDVYFKSDPTLDNPLLFQIGNSELGFQPAELSLVGATTNTSCENKDAKLEQKRAKEDAKIQQQRAKEDAKLQQQRAKEDAKTKCKKHDVVPVTQMVSQAPINNGVFVDGNMFGYSGIYGSGLDLQYNVNKDYVKEELIISDVASLPQPTNLTGDITLSLNSLMSVNNNNIIVDGGVWNQVAPIKTSNAIAIKDTTGTTIYNLEIPVAFDSNGAKVVGTYTLTNTSEGVNVAVDMPYSWFVDASRVYPVYLDPTIVWDGTSNLNGEIPRIVVSNVTIPVGTPYVISEIIVWGNDTIVDAECETDIINSVGSDIVDFRSFFNNQGIMEFAWTPQATGDYILAQYCWRGDTLVLNKIYSNSTITVI